MSSDLKECFNDLKFLSKIKCNKTQKVLLRYMATQPKYYKVLREISCNLIKGKEKLSKRQRSRLNKHVRVINDIALTKKKNKKLIVQSGGWMWIVPLISTIFDLVL